MLTAIDSGVQENRQTQTWRQTFDSDSDLPPRAFAAKQRLDDEGQSVSSTPSLNTVTP